jgi:lambda repressor-like predicted transcriptional regulator
MYAGTWLPRADPAPILAHVATLRRAGMSLAAVGRAAGVSAKTVQELPDRKYVHGPTAAAILAVKPGVELPARNMRPALGSARRVQALTAIGWSFTEQGRRCGMHTQQVWEIAWLRSQLVTVGTADRIHDLFEELSATPGPSGRARNTAVKHGWLPPLAWDDPDDPDEQPATDNDCGPDVVDEVAVARALQGQRVKLTDAETAVVLRTGRQRGQALSAITGRLGINYGKARHLVDAGESKRQGKQDRVEAEVRRLGATHSDYTIAGLLDVHRSTVSRARRRLAEQQQIAS